MYWNYVCVLFDKEYKRASIDNVYNRVLDLCRNNNIDLDLLNFLNEAYFFRQNDAFHIELNYIKYSYEHEIGFIWFKEKNGTFLKFNDWELLELLFIYSL